MEELDLKELFSLFWSKKLIIALLVLVFIVIGICYTMFLVTPKYTSTTTLLLATQQDSTKTDSTSTITTTDITLNSKLISTYSVLIKSKDVLRKVNTNLNMNMSENEMKNNVSVSAVSDTEVLKISVTNVNPEIAAKIANEIADVFTEQVKEIYKINNVHVVDAAEVEKNPSNVNHPKDVIIFAFIGIVISILYVLLENMLDTTVKTAEEIENQFSLPVLASIPLDSFEKKRGGKR